MATTRTPGITVVTDGRRFVEEISRGSNRLRIGAVTQETDL
jgi:hypothetical protein